MRFGLFGVDSCCWTKVRAPRATARQTKRPWPHWLPFGAQEYELSADSQHGVVLRIVAQHHGEVVEIDEITDVSFNEPIQDSLFSYTNGGVMKSGEVQPAVDGLTLDAAIVRLPFRVLLPTCVPDPEHSSYEVMYHPPNGRPDAIIMPDVSRKQGVQASLDR